MRTAVFIDYQNVYHAARRAFHSLDDPASFGQIAPRKLTELLCRKELRGEATTEAQLEQVRVYRGMPRAGDRNYSPARRQVAAWQADQVIVVTRPLQGPRNAPREKGIDISLALDFYEAARSDRFDLGILFSVDSDFEPLIEKLRRSDRRFSMAVETAAWWAPPRQVLQLGGRSGIPCHLLTESEYALVRDRRNYMAPRRGRR